MINQAFKIIKKYPVLL